MNQKYYFMSYIDGYLSWGACFSSCVMKKHPFKCGVLHHRILFFKEITQEEYCQHPGKSKNMDFENG